LEEFMGQNSSIEWTDHTFNPWVGCIKVSPGCKNCYAEELMTRKGRWANTWGPAQITERIKTSADNWRKPLAWNKQAEKEGKRYKVFCASLADVFEDNDQLIDWRLDLFELMKSTPMLDWQILTKRPDVARLFFRLRSDYLLPNIWMGTSVENQEYADKRIPELLQIPAVVRFLSVEPLLGPVDLWSAHYSWPNGGSGLGSAFAWGQGINWVIVGGESGPKARPMHPQWVRDLRDQCHEAGVAFFFKQHGEWISKPEIADLTDGRWRVRPEWLPITQGKRWGCLSIDGKYRPETPTWKGRQNDPQDDYEVIVYAVGKHAAGRMLDGRTWDEFPQSSGVMVF
jgi:protein gp37